MYSKNKKYSNSKKRIVFLALVIMLLGLLSAFAYRYVTNKDSSPSAGIKKGDSINYDPPTPTDKKRVENTKQNIANQQTQPDAKTPPQVGKKSVKPIITYAGQYGDAVEVGGQVSGIFEDGGSCEATFTKTPLHVSKKVQAVKDASSVSCPTISVASSEFSSKGTWQVELSYISVNYQGVSDVRSVDIK